MDVTLRTCTAGPEDVSPYGAIHKFNGELTDDGHATLLRRNRPAQPEGCAAKTGLGDAAREARYFTRFAGSG